MPSQDRRYDVFLSHNSADKPAVQVLADQLRSAGLDPFLDIWHLIPGTPWQEGIESALASSATTAVFVGPSGISPWHNEEMRDALYRAVRSRDDYRVIPVLLPGADEGSLTGFLARRVWVDFRSGLDDEAALLHLVAGVKGEGDEVGGYTLPDEPAPYRGLLPFEAEHTRFYFGREADIQRLMERLASHPFVAVVGASGSGKSSLVMAGLLPRLAQNALPDSSRWRVLSFTPGSQPLRSLANKLATLAPAGADRLQTADVLTERLQTRNDGLRTAVAAYQADSSLPVLLFIDQFEELFTLCQEAPEGCQAQVERFVANLADAMRSGNDLVRVLITLRADFLNRCLAHSSLCELLEDHLLLLGPMDEIGLREAIARPAGEVGAWLQQGLVEIILGDVASEPGSLPLLQQTLYELWLQRQGPWLTRIAYQKSGGVLAALQKRADYAYRSLTPQQQEIARNIFVRLTALGEGASDTRQRVPRQEIYPVDVNPVQVDAVLQLLSGRENRLVIADERTVEVAHEALILHWQTLRDWITESRDDLLVMRQLTLASNEWNTRGCDSSYLFLGSRLSNVVGSANRSRYTLNRVEHDFLVASRSLQDQQESVLVDKGKLHWNQVDLLLAARDTQAVKPFFRTALRHGPELVDQTDLLEQYLTRMWCLIAEVSNIPAHDDTKDMVQAPSHIQYLKDVLKDTSYSSRVRKWAAKTCKSLPDLDENLRLLLESMVLIPSKATENKETSLSLAFAALESLTHHNVHAIGPIVERAKAMPFTSEDGFHARVRLGSLLGTFSAPGKAEAQPLLASRHIDLLIWITSIGTTIAQVTSLLLTNAWWIWKEITLSWAYAATILMAGFLAQQLFTEPSVALPNLAIGSMWGLMLYYYPLRHTLTEAALGDNSRQYPANWLDLAENLIQDEDFVLKVLFPITTIFARTGLVKSSAIGHIPEERLAALSQIVPESYRGQTNSESLILYMIGGAAVMTGLPPALYIYALVAFVILCGWYLITLTPALLRLISSPIMAVLTRVPELILFAILFLAHVLFEIALVLMNLISILVTIVLYIPLWIGLSRTGASKRFRWRLVGSVILLLLIWLVPSLGGKAGFAVALWVISVSFFLYVVETSHVEPSSLQYISIGFVTALGIGLAANVPFAWLLVYCFAGGVMLARMASTDKRGEVDNPRIAA